MIFLTPLIGSSNIVRPLPKPKSIDVMRLIGQSNALQAVAKRVHQKEQTRSLEGDAPANERSREMSRSRKGPEPRGPGGF